MTSATARGRLADRDQLLRVPRSGVPGRPRSPAPCPRSDPPDARKVDARPAVTTLPASSVSGRLRRVPSAPRAPRGRCRGRARARTVSPQPGSGDHVARGCVHVTTGGHRRELRRARPAAPRDTTSYARASSSGRSPVAKRARAVRGIAVRRWQPASIDDQRVRRESRRSSYIRVRARAVLGRRDDRRRTPAPTSHCLVEELRDDATPRRARVRPANGSSREPREHPVGDRRSACESSRSRPRSLTARSRSTRPCTRHQSRRRPSLS